MNDKQLRGFIQIVEKGSFTAAADDLYITQSALSQQMKLLEQDVGFALFDHKTHKATLTEAGRAFYERARQMLALFERSIDEGLYLQQMEKEQRRPLFVGCLDEQFLALWLDLQRVLDEIQPHFKPRAVRYESRDKLIRALSTGECQVSVQLENRAYEDAGLLFVPFVNVREVALFSGEPPVLEPRVCTVEELSRYIVAFHNKRGECLYEDALRQHLMAAYPTARIIEPQEFPHAKRERRDRPVVLLIPSVQMPARAERYAVPLNWNDGMRLGLVMPPEPSQAVQECAKGFQEYYAEHPSPWL